MKLLLALLSLSTWLSSHLAQVKETPCLPANFTDGYNLTLKRHLSSGTPTTLNHEAWEAYLRRNTDCDKSLQSFLSPTDRGKVEDICTPKGGKQQSGNYCISKNYFTFISVQSELYTCIITDVTKVTKHIIVACDMVDEVCRPTQLKENQEDLVPKDNDPDCARTESYTMGFDVVMSSAGKLQLSLTLLGLALCYFMG